MDFSALKENLICTVESFAIKLDNASKIHEANMETLRNELKAAHAELALKNAEVQDLRAASMGMDSRREQLETQVKELETKIKSLEEENANFKKVSQIIAYEKENRKLKDEIRSLTNRLVKLESAAKQANVCPSLSTTDHFEQQSDKQSEQKQIVADVIASESSSTEVGELDCESNKQCQEKIADNDEEENQDEEDDNGLALYEKKINKTTYFVSDDDDMRIFIKTETGEVGDEVGHLVKVDGKLKPVWD